MRRLHLDGFFGYLILILLVLFIVAPMVSVVLWAFAEQWRYPSLLPTQWGFRFWEATLSRADVLRALPLSLGIASLVTFLSAAICLPAAYAFARLKFRGLASDFAFVFGDERLSALRALYRHCGDLFSAQLDWDHHRCGADSAGQHPPLNDLDSDCRVSRRR